jgi:predicted HAD superfamily Cof-like phosphohydrolase
MTRVAYDYQNDVEEFMKACGQDVIYASERGVENFTEQAELYKNLIIEEFQETIAAFAEKDIVEVADGLADMVWVIMGLASTLDIPFHKVWDEVKASNMSKTVKGKVKRREDGKILKPDTYFRPNIRKAMDLDETD